MRTNSSVRLRSAVSSSPRTGACARSISRACARAVIERACSCRRSTRSQNFTTGCGPGCPPERAMIRHMTPTSDEALRKLAMRVARRMRAAGEGLVTAESCTGGMLAKCLTDLPGSSAYFDRGWVTYSNVAKHEELRVEGRLLARYGAVSEEVALATVDRK